MDRFHALAVFVAVAEEESFAAAGRRLRMSPPAVTRAVADLEERLGVRLLTRTTRLVRTTDAGARYLEDARRILLEVDEADEAAAGINATPRGHLAVTAPMLFGKLYVMPVITAYQRAFKETTVSALFVDRVVNLLDEGLDVGLRIGSLPDSSLRAIRVGQVRRVICASPGYLKKHGCWRRSNFDPPCRPNFDPGLIAGRWATNCG
jgi:DNA-binding transcriptional LysR family regulator